MIVVGLWLYLFFVILIIIEFCHCYSSLWLHKLSENMTLIVLTAETGCFFCNTLAGLGIAYLCKQNLRQKLSKTGQVRNGELFCPTVALVLD